MTDSKSLGSKGRSSGGRPVSAGRERTSLVTFYRQVIAELRKVVWPTQQQLVTYFIVVVSFVLFFMAVVSLLDLGFGKAVFALFGSK